MRFKKIPKVPKKQKKQNWLNIRINKLSLSNTADQHKRLLNFSEAQGRDWRFRCIARIYLTENYEIVLTGHTATDRSETALIQLIRGTSFRGLTSLGRNKTFKSVYPKYFNYSVFFC